MPQVIVTDTKAVTDTKPLYDVIHLPPWWIVVKGEYPGPDYAFLVEVNEDDFPGNAEGFARFARSECERLNNTALTQPTGGESR